MPQTIDKRILGIIAGMGVLIAALIWAVFFWQMQNVKRISEDYQKEKLNSLVLQEKEKKLTLIKKDITNLDEQNRKLQSMFLKKGEALPFLEELEKAAGIASCQIKVNPVDIRKIKFEKGKTAEKKPAGDELDDEDAKENKQATETPKQDDIASLKDYPAFTVEAEGKFSNVFEFLAKVETLPYFVRVLTLDAAVAEAKEKKVAADGNLVAGGSASPAPDSPDKNIKLTFVAVVYGE